jgi:TonB family protein
MDILTLSNIGHYTAQIVSVVALATLVGWLLRIETPGVRYAYWQAIFVLCLLLPFVQGRQVPEIAAAGTTVVTEQIFATAEPTSAAASAPFNAWLLVLPVLAAGVALRMLWLALSFVRLRRLRNAGERATESPIHRELQEWIEVRCEIRYVNGLRQPVTFGIVRPVILLPAALAERSEEIQRAVLSHELFHVRRRDWGWLLIEEVICALLWFNPAIWWLVSRIHLAREVVVDELAVLATGRRRAYVEALIAFADDTSLAPVAAFGSRPQLFNRIVMLSKEAGMSSRRLLFTCAAALAVISAGTWHTVAAFPLSAVPSAPQAARHETPGPLEQRAKPITPENPIPRRTMYEAPEYPVEARVANARGNVTVMLTLDELGRIAEVRRLSLSVTTPTASVRFSNARAQDFQRFLVNGSPSESDAIRAAGFAMQEAAFRAVERWRYDSPADGPISFPMVVTFKLDGEVTAGRGRGAAPGNTVVGGGVEAPPGTLRVGGNIKTPTKILDVRPVYPALAQSARVSGMVIAEILVGTDGAVQDARILRSIPLLDQAALDAVRQWQFTPTLLNGVPTPVIMTVTVNFTLQEGNDVETLREVEPEGQRPAASARTRSWSPELVKEVRPTYTAEAMRAGVEGNVEIEAVIGTNGTVTSTRVVKGHPMLTESATAAVQQWLFKPIPEPFTATIELTFRTRK